MPKYVSVNERETYIEVTFNIKDERDHFTLNFLLDLIDSLTYVDNLRKYDFVIFKSNGESFGKGISPNELLAANASKEKASMLARYLYEIYKKLIDLEKLKIAAIKGLIINEGMDFLLGMDLIIAKPETYLFDIRSSIGLNSPLLNTLGPFVFPINFIKKLLILKYKVNITELPECCAIADYISDIPESKSVEVIEKIRTSGISTKNINIRRNIFELIDEKLKNEIAIYTDLITKSEFKSKLLTHINEFS